MSSSNSKWWNNCHRSTRHNSSPLKPSGHHVGLLINFNVRCSATVFAAWSSFSRSNSALPACSAVGERSIPVHPTEWHGGRWASILRYRQATLAQAPLPSCVTGIEAPRRALSIDQSSPRRRACIITNRPLPGRRRDPNRVRLEDVPSRTEFQGFAFLCNGSIETRACRSSAASSASPLASHRLAYHRIRRTVGGGFDRRTSVVSWGQHGRGSVHVQAGWWRRCEATAHASPRMVRMGSTADARRAGSQLANNPVISNAMAVAMKVMGSRGVVS